MNAGPVGTGHDRLHQAIAQLTDATGPAASADELIDMLRVCEEARRALDRAVVNATADLQRRGVFAERGYRSPAGALSDLLGWERFEARRRVIAAENVCAQIGLDGAPLPARLPATATVFAAGEAGLRHVEVIARLLDGGPARRLSPETWAGAEVQLAAKAGIYTPSELHTWGAQLLELLDQDGPAPDDSPSAQINELRLSRFRTRPGGKLTGVPLDVGRLSRTVPDGLRRAITVRDGGCAFPGGDRPPSWCEVHHVREWQHGGPTCLSNLVMLCAVHHRLIHHSHWEIRMVDGLPEFLPPSWIDRGSTAAAHPADDHHRY